MKADERELADEALYGDLEAEALGEPQASHQVDARVVLRWLGKYGAALGFVGGLLLGWLVIGWWLWPARQANSFPWHLQPAYQKRYVALVADEHYRTGDVAQARQDLAGWNSEALAALLTTIEKEAPSAEARQPVAALRLALAVPVDQPSLWTTLLRQGAIFWSGALAVVLLTAAMALAIVPPRRKRSRAPAQHGAAGDAEGLLAGKRAAAPEPWLEAIDDAEAEDSGESAESSAQEQAGNGGGESSAAGKGSSGGVKPARKVERIQLSGSGNDSGAEGGGTATERTRKSGEAKPAGETSPKQAQDSLAQALAADKDTGEPPDTQELLSNLLDDVDLLDSRRAVLNELVEDVAIADLARQSDEVLEQLRQLCLSSCEA